MAYLDHRAWTSKWLRDKTSSFSEYSGSPLKRLTFCPPTLVMGTSISPSISPSVHPFIDTILSPQLLLQFLRDFDETFQLLFPLPEDDHMLSRSCSTDFYQSYSK